MAIAQLPSRYLEHVTRLLLGVQPMDALRQQRIVHKLEVRVEPKAWADPLSSDQQRWLQRRIVARRPLSDSWPLVQRHASGRYALSYGREQGSTINVRVLDRSERVVPRRFRIPLAALGTPEDVALLDALPVGQRSRTVSLFPGAAYDISDRVTGLRGRVVVSDGSAAGTRIPVRWPRVEARLPAGGNPIAWAHGDQHGEFLLVLPPEALAVPPVELPPACTISVTARGRGGVPANAPPLLVQQADALWDLPVETLGAPGIPATSDLVGLGQTIPQEYDRSFTQAVTFTYSQTISSTVLPFDLT